MARPEWKKRLTYVTTTRQNLTGRSASVGTVINAERLLGVQVRCPRCDKPAAIIWRRFDYFGADLPLYFTKCRRCHRRRPIDADEAAFRLLEAGITDPVPVLQGAAASATDGEDGARPDSRGAGEYQAEAQAEQLVANRQRAYGRKHPLTFEARAQLAEAIGRSGDADRAARSYEQLIADQTASGRHPSPSVLTNRYRAAVWTAQSGSPSAALAALQGLLADQEGVLGPDDANVLVTRAAIAQLMAETGDRDEAIDLLRRVVQDQLRVLGSEHPTTELTRQLLDEWEGRR